ncbi:Uncharacterised protein [Vibrio cholerae]|nr:Uncharacterised protein [Vibrio cholerae]
MFEQSITSNCAGSLISCMVALSMYMCESETSGYSLAISLTTSRHSIELCSTLALSIEQTFLRRKRADSKAIRAIRSISKRW